MRRRATAIVLFTLAAPTLLGLVACHRAPEAPGETQAATVPEGCVSTFGAYDGCTDAVFDEWVTKSVYIPTRDGTRLAADISIPAVDGVAVKERFPVIWTYTRYHRRWGDTPNIDSNPVRQEVLKHGYVIVVVNVRGGGASFGRYEGLFSAVETRDAWDVMEWLSTQDFSSGKLGMSGLSYMGITQYMAASTRHPALKAIMPELGYFDFYDAIRRGGILRADMVRTWAQATQYLDKEKPPVPVDADTDGSLAAEAVAEHETNFDPTAPLSAAKFRDSTAPEFDWLTDMPSMVWGDIAASGIPIYHAGAWHDAYTTDTLLMDANYPGTDRLLMGPWAHGPQNDAEREDYQRVMTAETLRWYDYWLKGIDNGVLDGPRINVSIIDTPRKSWTWKPLSGLPGDDARIDWYLTNTPADDTVELPDDFQLTSTTVEESSTQSYDVNPETTTGTTTRWDSNFGGQADYPDMTENDKRSLVFTSRPLDRDLVILGVPIATVYLSSSTPDADVYVLLEEVDETGASNYASEGMLRASLRKESPAPWRDNLGQPWHHANKEDQQMLAPDEVVQLGIPMMPTAHLFNKGNRIRIVIMGADKDNTEAPLYPDARLSISLGGQQASRVSLPVLSE